MARLLQRSQKRLKKHFPKAKLSVAKGFGAIGKTVDYAGLGLIGMGLLDGSRRNGAGMNRMSMNQLREGQAFPNLFYDPVTGQYSDTAPEGIRVIQGPIRRVNAGGAVAGPGTGTSDSIPAMLSDGEFVMTAKAVRGMGGW